MVDVNFKAVESVVALIATRYPNVKAIVTKTDVGVEGEIKDAVDLAVKEFGRLDIIVRLFPLAHAHQRYSASLSRLITEIMIRVLTSDYPVFP